MKVINAIWFNEMGSFRPIGIVVAEDEATGERKAYVGTGAGQDEYTDAHSIIKRGAKLRTPTSYEIYSLLKVKGK